MKRKQSARTWFSYILLLILFAAAIVMVESGAASRQFKTLLVPIAINILLALSLNLTVGFLGELTLGHAGFMSVGAYAGCLLSIQLGDALPMLLRLSVSMLFGGLIAALFGILIGVPVLRLKGDYLAIVTLAFGEIIRSVIINLDFTGGAAGLKGISRDLPRDSNYIIAFAVVLITLAVITNLVRSRQGRAIMAIRDNRIAAESVGINITYHKLLAFVIAAFFAGVAGVLYGHNIGALDAAKFDYNRSIEILVIVVLGGMGSISGSIISAVLITILPEMLRSFSDYRLLAYSVVLIVMMILNSSPRFAAFKEKCSPSRLLKRNRADAQSGEEA